MAYNTVVAINDSMEALGYTVYSVAYTPALKTYEVSYNGDASSGLWTYNVEFVNMMAIRGYRVIEFFHKSANRFEMKIQWSLTVETEDQ